MYVIHNKCQMIEPLGGVGKSSTMYKNKKNTSSVKAGIFVLPTWPHLQFDI